MDEKHSKDAGVSRRTFVKGALAGSAVLAMGLPQMLHAEESPSNLDSHASFHSLPPGAIRPEGWVRGHLESQAKLTNVVGDISWPFSGKYWVGEEENGGWYAWEQKGYWIDGGTRLALLLGDEELLAKMRVPIDYTLAHPSSSGFLGPQFLEFGEDMFGGLQRWPNIVMYRSMMALADAAPSPNGVQPAEIADALRRHYLNDKASYSSGNRNITNLEVVLWCYGKTGDKNLLALAENCWEQSSKDAEANFQAMANRKTVGNGRRRFSHTDLSASRVFANEPIQTHGVSYAEVSKLPAILYLYNGQEDLVKFAVAAQRRFSITTC